MRGYSSDITLWLAIDDAKLPLPLSHVAPTFIRPRRAVAAAPGTPATVVIVIDGEPRRRSVVLPDGMKLTDIDVDVAIEPA